MTYLVIGPNQCCGCSAPTFVGLFVSRAEAETAAQEHNDDGRGYEGTTVIDLDGMNALTEIDKWMRNEAS